MKVKIGNKKLWTNFTKRLSASTALLSFFLTIVDTTQKVRIIVFICFFIGMFFIFLFMWIAANKKVKRVSKSI